MDILSEPLPRVFCVMFIPAMALILELVSFFVFTFLSILSFTNKCGCVFLRVLSPKVLHFRRGRPVRHILYMEKSRKVMCEKKPTQYHARVPLNCSDQKNCNYINMLQFF